VHEGTLLVRGRSTSALNDHADAVTFFAK